MKRNLKKILHVVVLMACIAVILSLPTVYFRYQEQQLLNYQGEIPVETIEIEKNTQGQLTIEQRRELVIGEDKEIESIKLKTGNKYSLYEARRKCFKELSKLPVLEMDLYGPTQKEINILPRLIIDPVTPAYSMIIWEGSVEIKEHIYDFIFDEESGKLLNIKSAETKTAKDNLQETLKEQWEKYFYP